MSVVSHTCMKKDAVQYEKPILLNGLTEKQAEFLSKAAAEGGVSRAALMREAALRTAEKILGKARPA